MSLYRGVDPSCVFKCIFFSPMMSTLLVNLLPWMHVQKVSNMAIIHIYKNQILSLTITTHHLCSTLKPVSDWKYIVRCCSDEVLPSFSSTWLHHTLTIAGKYNYKFMDQSFIMSMFLRLYTVHHGLPAQLQCVSQPEQCCIIRKNDWWVWWIWG